jgi:hypothetical protein
MVLQMVKQQHPALDERVRMFQQLVSNYLRSGGIKPYEKCRVLTGLRLWMFDN